MTEAGSAEKSIGKFNSVSGVNNAGNQRTNSPLARLVAQHAYNETQKGSLIDKDLQIQKLMVENAELKDSIENMKNDMETIVLQVKEANLRSDFAKEQEFMNKH